MGMLDNLKKKIKSLTEKAPTFDPASLNDEVAMKTKWNPACGGGTNVCTHRLKEISGTSVSFKPCAMAIIFPGIFMLAGLGVFCGAIYAGVVHKSDFIYFGIPFGGIFFTVGYLICRSWLVPRTFDQMEGCYWKGKGRPHHLNNKIKDKCELKEIYAIQLISEYCSGDKSSYYSYELNLVLKDGERINITDHGNKKAILEDAEKLAEFLNIPVWNAM